MKPKIVEYKPPYHCYSLVGKSIFLGGSIEMGKAEDWQKRITQKLEEIDEHIFSIYVFNPRRSDWDSSWEQNKNSAQFYEQVTWELDHLNLSDVIAMNFIGETLSPISLLELGLHASSGKMVVLCPDDYWRKGNVDIVCSDYGIPIFTDEDAWLKEIIRRLR